MQDQHTGLRFALPIGVRALILFGSVGNVLVPAELFGLLPAD